MNDYKEEMQQQQQQPKEAGGQSSSSAEDLTSEAGQLASSARDESRSCYVDGITGSIRDGTSLNVAQYFKNDISSSARFFCLDIGNNNDFHLFFLFTAWL